MRRKQSANTVAIIGKAIQAGHTKSGWTLSELARLSGLSAAVISEYEHERVTPSVEAFCVLGRLLGLDLNAIAKDVVERRDPQ